MATILSFIVAVVVAAVVLSRSHIAEQPSETQQNQTAKCWALFYSASAISADKTYRARLSENH